MCGSNSAMSARARNAATATIVRVSSAASHSASAAKLCKHEEYPFCRKTCAEIVSLLVKDSSRPSWERPLVESCPVGKVSLTIFTCSLPPRSLCTPPSFVEENQQSNNTQPVRSTVSKVTCRVFAICNSDMRQSATMIQHIHAPEAQHVHCT